MMKKSFLIVALILVLGPKGLEAAAAAGRVAAPYLNLPMSVRATGMGEAFTGIADDDGALYYNPAGMAQVDSSLASFMHLQGFGGVNYEYLGLLSPLSLLGLDEWGSMGLSYELIGMDSVQRTRADASGNFDQAYSDRNFTYTAGGSVVTLAGSWQATNMFALGASVKVINQRVDDVDGTGIAGDFALFTRPKYFPGLSAGFVVQNVGASPDKGAPMPSNLRVGFGYALDHPFSDPAMPVDKLQLGADLIFPIVPTDGTMRMALGGEYSRWFMHGNYVAVRLGYRLPTDLGALAGLTTGLGYGMEFPGTVVGIDYAFVPYGELGVTHRISITGNFGLRKTVAPKGAREPLEAPGNVRAASAGDKRVELTWEAPLARVDGYNVYMTYDPVNGPWHKVNKRLVTVPSLTSAGLYNGYRYFFSIASVQKEGTRVMESARSRPISYTPMAAQGASQTPSKLLR